MTTASLPHHDTQVTYPNGATESFGEVIFVAEMPDGKSGVILDRTAFHPIDTAWPDQPSDRGRMHTARGSLEIIGAVTGAIHEGVLAVGEDVPVRTGTPEWTFVVVHIVEGQPPAVGEAVGVEVDQDYRAGLSAGHTACHLAALALDLALADSWSKQVPPDALGNPGFDALAIQRSEIEQFGSTDTYRVGKSLRRKGFVVSALDDLDALTERANSQLAEWIATKAPVRIERTSDNLSARRTWVCELPERNATIPCGGTHTRNLHELSEVSVSLETTSVEGGLEMIMRTVVKR